MLRIYTLLFNFLGRSSEISGGFYRLCCKYQGRPVEIRDRFGKVHREIIDRFTPTHVFIRPFLPYGPKNPGGFG